MKKLSAVVLAIIALIALTSSHPIPSEMNACGISFNQTKDRFMEEYNQTLLDALYYTEILERHQRIEEIVCYAEMACKADARRLFTSTAYYLQYTQLGITEMNMDDPCHYEIEIGDIGFITIDRRKRWVVVVFEKK